MIKLLKTKQKAFLLYLIFILIYFLTFLYSLNIYKYVYMLLNLKVHLGAAQISSMVIFNEDSQQSFTIFV